MASLTGEEQCTLTPLSKRGGRDWKPWVCLERREEEEDEKEEKEKGKKTSGELGRSGRVELWRPN